MQNYDVDIAIMGAGASGLMAAYFCSLNGKSVLVIDHNKTVGRKILISGGGKCNFTNKYGEASDYYCENPHFVKSALSRFNAWDFMDMIEKHKVRYSERKFGQLFCSESAKEINRLLVEQIQRPNIEVILEQRDIEVKVTDDGFNLTNNKSNILARKLIVATGGLVLPSIGASPFGHILAKRFGHKIIPTTPALVPFKVIGFNELAGISFICGVTCNGRYVEDDLLFTHKGFSGPCTLKASLFWNNGDPIEVNWLPGKSAEKMMMDLPANAQVDKVLKKFLPSKFIDVFFDRIDIDGKLHIGKLSKESKKIINRELHSMTIIPSGTEGFRKAEVTRGGICTKKISSKTLESKLQPNVHFIGEVLDVTGQLGGHNFQWCWASAFAVGEALK